MFELAMQAANVQAEAAPRPVAEIVASAPDPDWREVPAEQLLLLETEAGRLTVMLSSVLAQDHVDQLRTLAREGFYDGLGFYRVVEGFVAQGGDPTGTREKGSAAGLLRAEFEEPLPDDAPFTPFPFDDPYAPLAGHIESLPAGRDPETGTVWLAHCTGAFAFARDFAPDSAATEFYITLQPHRYLDRNMTVVGRVIDGMSVVQAAPRGVADSDPQTDDFSGRLRIDGITVAAELPVAARPRWRILRSGSPSFNELTRARSARPSDFFVHRPNHVALCQMPVPVERIDG